MFKAILYPHIAVGTIALLSGITAIITRKGSPLHLKSGIVYYWCMYAVATTALVMSILHFSPFLLPIAILAFYFTLSGRIAIDYYRMREPFTPKLIEKLPAYIGFVTSLFMLGFPVYRYSITGNSFIFVLAVFGLILFLNTLSDIRRFRSNTVFQPRNKKWLIKHIGMMSGAYISTTTAFLVNVVHFEPAWVLWLAPTAAGLVFISVSIRRWNKKLRLN